jgi:hypothetical protein
MLGLSCGCGLLAERLVPGRIPTPLLPVVGFAAIIVVGQFLTLADATAELTAPVVVALALAGLALAVRGRRRPLEPWAFVAAAGVLAVYAAPIVLSGDPTIAGFIKLDDTATWLALTDRIMDHGRDLGGLAPSTYEATLHFNLGDGYPIGVFVPFGVGTKLLATDPVWLIQPYIACGAALLALALWSLATPLVRMPRLRALAAFLAAQSALLFGYYLWGGIKEVIAAALVAGFVALAIRLRGQPASVVSAGGALLVGAALVGVLSAGGLVWLAPALGALAFAGLRGAGVAATVRRALIFSGVLAVLALPTIVSGALLPPTSSPLTGAGARGNLAESLAPAQAAGIWPAGDFRFHPDAELAAYALIAVACLAAVAGLVWCWRQGELAPLVYVGGALASCAALVIVGSPWVGGKALATASPAIPFAAVLGVGWLAAGGRRLAAAGVAVAVAGGILWSNALGYGGVSLAPHDQLAELERIGDRIEGQGPTLMTEYEPYGARHFLRDADAEGISELRRHEVTLRDGTEVAKGGSADTDRVDPGALGYFRTLVVRRSPAQSRPPSPYRLIWRGTYYEAWQRPAVATPLRQRLPLGGRYDPYGVPDCSRVTALARRGPLVAAAGEPPLVFGADPPESPGRGPTRIEAEVRVPRRAGYEIWLGGSVRSGAEVLVDGEPAGEVRHQLNNEGGYVRLGSAGLDRGVHQVEVRFDGPDLHPGSAGYGGQVGPLSLSSTDPSQTRLVSVPASRAHSLCGHRWDWIESAS